MAISSIRFSKTSFAIKILVMILAFIAVIYSKNKLIDMNHLTIQSHQQLINIETNASNLNLESVKTIPVKIIHEKEAKK